MIIHETKIKIGRLVLPLIGEIFSDDFQDERLRTTLGKHHPLQLPNPVILDAYYSKAREWNAALKLGFGAVTTKTFTVPPLRGHPYPRVIPVGEGYVNCERFPNPGILGAAIELARFDEQYSGNVIVSIAFVDTVSELKGLATTFQTKPIEINISSPNTEAVYNLSRNQDMVRRAIMYAREVTDGTLGLKLSPDFEEENFRYVIPAAIECGVDYVKWGNTRKVKDARLSMGEGGLSGPALYSDMIRNLERAYREFGSDIDFVGAGGINTPQRAEEVLKVAKAVALLSAFPKIPYGGRHGFLIAQRINIYLASR